MDDPLLVGVLHRPADREEQLQPLAGRQLVLVAELGDRDALDQLHDEVRSARVGGTRVEDASDVRVVHHGQRLPLGVEAGEDLAAVHAGLDDLQGDEPPHRVGLLGHVDGAHAALADRLQELVGDDDGTGPLISRRHVDCRSADVRHVQQPQRPRVRPQQGLDLVPQPAVVPAGCVQERGPPFGRGDLNRPEENRPLIRHLVVHRASPHLSSAL